MAEFLASFVPALGHALLSSLWQGTLIGLLAALALHVLRHARPQARYAVACLALLACVLVPLATLVAQLAATSYEPRFGGMPMHAPRIGDSPDTSGVLFGFAPPAEQIDALLPWMVALWAAGTCVMSLRMALGLAWIRRLRHTPQGAGQAAWQLRLDALAVHFGLRRGVALRLVDSLDSPVSAGWWHPVVLLPTALLTRMPVDLIEALLAHELAHIRRHDYLVNLLQNAVEALLFYHPITWWLSRRIRIEREQIADQLAAEVACAPCRLAVALSELSELHRTRPAFRLAQAAHGGQLLSRIQQLVRPTRRAHPSARIVFPLLGLAAACIASYSYAQIGEPDSYAIRPTTAAPDTHAFQVSRSHDAARETFVLVRRGGNKLLAWGPDDDDDDMAALEAAKRSVDGDFIWVRRDGLDYVITDPALVARAGQAWRKAETLSQRLEALSGQMEVHSKKMQALGDRMERLSMRHDPTPETRTGLRKMEALAQQHHAVARQQHELAKQLYGDVAQSDAAQRQRLERQMNDLSVKQDELARAQERQAEVMDAETRRFEAPMEALVREMDMASKPMQALSQRIDAVSREHEKTAEQAARDLRTLISEALAKGLAKSTLPRASVQ